LSSPQVFDPCFGIDRHFGLPSSCFSNTPITEKAQTSYLLDSCDHADLGTLQLTFSRSQLTSYKKWRTAGLDRKSVNWMKTRRLSALHRELARSHRDQPWLSIQLQVLSNTALIRHENAASQRGDYRFLQQLSFRHQIYLA
jgi:hypothetical protein